MKTIGGEGKKLRTQNLRKRIEAHPSLKGNSQKKVYRAPFKKKACTREGKDLPILTKKEEG